MKKIIIFGAGESKGGLNKYAIRKAERMGMEILFLVDNDEKKHNTIFWCSDNMNEQNVHGQYKIFPAEHIADVMDKDTFIIIATEVEHKEIEQQLINLGVDKDKFSYIKRMKDFYNYNEHLYEYLEEKKLIKEKNGKMYPRTLRIEITSFCNLKCEYCGFHGEIFKKLNVKSEHMEFDTLKEIIRQIKEWGTVERFVPFIGGEMFMHPQWFEICQYFAENTKISELITYTNGMLLNEKNIEKLLKLKYKKIKIVISIDGRSKEENDYYRKGSKYDIIKAHIHSLMRKMDERFKISIANTLITTEDKSIEVMRGSLEECKFLKDEFGDNVEMRSIPTFIRPFMYEDYKQKLIEHLELSDIKRIKVDMEGRGCDLPFCEMSFDTNGNILMCGCTNERYILGNIMCDNALDVWNNETMKKIRDCYKNGTSIELCEGCNAYKGEDCYEYVLCKEN